MASKQQMGLTVQSFPSEIGLTALGFAGLQGHCGIVGAPGLCPLFQCGRVTDRCHVFDSIDPPTSPGPSGHRVRLGGPNSFAGGPGHRFPRIDSIAAWTTVLVLRKLVTPLTRHLSGRLDAASDSVDNVMERRRRLSMQAALSASFAFGGRNAVLAFRADPEPFHYGHTR